MSKGQKKLPLDGTEILELANSGNTKQTALSSLTDIADWINSFDQPAEVLMIALLQDIKRNTACLPELVEAQLKTNKLLEEILSS